MDTFICRDCKGEFPVSESVKDGSRKRGIMERCKPCDRARKKAYRDDPVTGPVQRERVRQAMTRPHMKALQRRYMREKRWAEIGASHEYYAKRFEQQDGRCDICGTDVPLRGERVEECFCIDHDHVTRQLRSLLCVACNSMIGFAQDDPDRLAKGIEYLAKWGIVEPRQCD